ncbi:phage holin family protein [Solimicrobium silvestre]|uniref:3TM holin, Phage_holin_3 n=1 Tax=Solimicrobium silvestre TaxID=2099400 RepID=A0A2S9GT26_9BURK|nr:phage holin family protein [Solimicrobium silvestre]PRC90870.1 hypothetical protein S2091_4451 [Solimicrobium silvestre]
MTKLLMLITLLSYIGTCARLLSYRRGLGNYRLKISLAAWCLILFTGTNAIDILLHPHAVSFGNAGIAVTLFLLVWRARGNVASITRSDP